MRLDRAGASNARARASRPGPHCRRRPPASITATAAHCAPRMSTDGARAALAGLCGCPGSPSDDVTASAGRQSGSEPESRARIRPRRETYPRVAAEGRSAWLCTVRFRVSSLPLRWVEFCLPPEVCVHEHRQAELNPWSTRPAHGVCILYPQTRRGCVGLKEKPVRLNETFPFGSFSFLIVHSHKCLSGHRPAMRPTGKESASPALSPKNLLCKPGSAEACSSGEMGKP